MNNEGIANNHFKWPVDLLGSDEGVLTGKVTKQDAIVMKYDSGKTRYELLPPELMYGVAEILTFGARKYADRNWELGMDWSRVYGALMRHLWAWWNPFQSSVDEETGKSHLWHAGCCIAFLIAYEQRNVGKDDRPVK